MPAMKIEFKAIKWDYRQETDEEGTNKGIIYISGITRDDKTVMVRITDFLPFVYMSLPKRKNSKYKWSQDAAEQIFQNMSERWRTIGFDHIEYVGTKKFIHGGRLQPCAKVFFKTYKDCGDFERRIHDKNSRVTIDVQGWTALPCGHFTVHESRIPPEIKLTSELGLKLAGWLECTGKRANDQSDYDINLEASCHGLKATTIDDSVQVHPKTMSFDLECYSENHNSKIPDPNGNNPIITVHAEIFKMGEPTSRSVTICQGQALPAEDDTEIICTPDEKGLIKQFISLVREEKIIILTGHNIMRFDLPYLLKRAEKNGLKRKLLQLEPIIGREAEVKKTVWQSSAYGVQEFEYPDYVGKMYIDTYVELQRNPVAKLTKFSLEEVSSTILKEHKEDLTPHQLFRLWLIWSELSTMLAKGAHVKEIKRRMLELLPEKKCTGKVADVRRDILNATKDTIEDAIKSTITYINIYCKQDCVLVQRLCSKINIWDNLCAMSNITHVPISYLHTRGQMIKAVAQAVRLCMEENTIINRTESEIPNYEGAYVVDSKGRIVFTVVIGDFASLYPSIIISKNISPDSIPDESVPDSLCNVTEWEEHRGCEHDTRKHKIKIKAEKIICVKRKTRFLKVIVDAEGKIQNEGIIPRLVRTLISKRKLVRLEMAKLEGIVKFVKGTDDEELRKFFTANKWEQPAMGSMDPGEIRELEIKIKYLNGMQNGLKVSANSVYGAFGARTSAIRDYDCCGTVTSTGRELIRESINIIKTDFDTQVVYGDTDSVMMDLSKHPWQQAYDLGLKITKVITHRLKCMLLNLDPNGKITGDDEKLYNLMPLKLEFERMFKFLVLYKKKRYIALPINKDGKEENLLKKGIVLVRRDNAQITRDVYTSVMERLLDMLREHKPIEYIQDQVEYIICQEAYKVYANISNYKPVPSEFTLPPEIKALMTPISFKVRRDKLIDQTETLDPDDRCEAELEITRLSRTRSIPEPEPVPQIPDSKWAVYMSVKNVEDYAQKNKKGQFTDVSDDHKDIEARKTVQKPIGPLDPRLDYRKAAPHVKLALRMIRRGDSVPANTRLEFIILENDTSSKAGDKYEDLDYYRDQKDEKLMVIDRSYYWSNKIRNQIGEIYKVTHAKQRVPYIDVQETLKEYFKPITIQGCRSLEAKLLYASGHGLKGKARTKRLKQYTDIANQLKSWYAMHILTRLRVQHGQPKPRWRKPQKTGERRKNVIVKDAYFFDKLESAYDLHKKLVILLRRLFSRVVVGNPFETEIGMGNKIKKYIREQRWLRKTDE